MMIPSVMDQLEQEYIEEAMKPGLSKEKQRICILSRDMFQQFRATLEADGQAGFSEGLKVYLAAATEILGMSIAMTENSSGALTKTVTSGLEEIVRVMRPKFDQQRTAIKLLHMCLQAGAKADGS